MAPLVPRLLCVALFAAAGNAAGQRSKCKKRDMAGSLKDCKTIVLDFDKLSKPEVDKIVALVGSESNLRFLSLRDNGIDEADALALAEALKHNRNLYSLRYRENPLGAAVVGAIASHPALTDLDVRGTKIGDEGAASLAQLLSSSAVLTGLQLRSASIGGAGGGAADEPSPREARDSESLRDEQRVEGARRRDGHQRRCVGHRLPRRRPEAGAVTVSETAHCWRGTRARLGGLPSSAGVRGLLTMSQIREWCRLQRSAAAVAATVVRWSRGIT